MPNVIILILIAAVGGVAVTLQSQFMGLMDKNIGTLESVFITYATGGVIIAGLMVLQRGGNLVEWRTVPWYALTSGVIGLVIVGTIGYTTPRLGLVAALTVVVASQFVTGAVIDHFGFFAAQVRTFDVTRMAGIGALLLGVWLLTR